MISSSLGFVKKSICPGFSIFLTCKQLLLNMFWPSQISQTFLKPARHAEQNKENKFSVMMSYIHTCISTPGGMGGGVTLGIFWWGYAAGTLKPLAYTRASSAELLP